MGQKQEATADTTPAGPKKRRRVGFPNIDVGINPNECIKIYLVSSKEEVGALDSFCLTPVDLTSFFDEEDGKIYGYQELKITIWVSIISFHAYADITFQSQSDGGKGMTDLKSALQRIFAETLLENKDDFLQTFSAESCYIRSIIANGEILQHKSSNGQIGGSNGHLVATTSDLELVRLVLGSEAAGHLYSRLVPLVLLLVDGSNPIDVTDPKWELYVLIQKKNDKQGDIQDRLLGFAAIYRFYHYPDCTRLRLGQVLVLPPYQHSGYGRHLVEVLSNVAISEDVFDLTVEEPLDHFQHIRTCVDIQHLLNFEPIQDAVNSAVTRLKHGKLSKKTSVPRFVPPPSVIEDVRKSLKINRKQFFQCWEVMIYLGLDPVDKYLEDFVTVISNHVRTDILGKESGGGGKQVIEIPSDYDPEMSFAMFRSLDAEASNNVQIDGNQTTQEEQLKQLVDERVKEIKLIAQKMHRS
uniref:histone acetyltransferase n=3 Tax=Rhizophora mucronata TaxID=61149 RepID=A0A2P2JTP9_RHIMU